MSKLTDDNMTEAQKQLLQLSLSRKAIPSRECFQPIASWNVPLGVSANEAVKAGITPVGLSRTDRIVTELFDVPISPNQYTASLVLLGGRPCIYGNK